MALRRATWLSAILGLAAVVSAEDDDASQFDIVNGQIYTPGLAIVDAPQPFTPLGGDYLHVAIEISGNGKLPWPQSPDSDDDSVIQGINIFLTTPTRNFTVANGTLPSGDDRSRVFTSPYVGPVMEQEPDSTVKHINWYWPDCFVGEDDDGDDDDDSARGDTNISLHQYFRWNGTEYFTVFDLPISVTNSIEDKGNRTDCSMLENERLSSSDVNASVSKLPSKPWIGGDAQSGVAAGEGEGGAGMVKWNMGLLVVGASLAFVFGQ
ncbi:hypothetical protein FQN54_006192 [Arachnomyces sp. PD_36]|nr:hypothetical protein FQN54_006192 [Arachnomyces sp. PD_36]